MECHDESQQGQILGTFERRRFASVPLRVYVLVIIIGQSNAYSFMAF